MLDTTQACAHPFDALDPKDRVMVALDCSFDRALVLADALVGHVGGVKVGMTLFYAEGPRAVTAMRERGYKVFLDLKLHDIPHQIEGAARAAAQTGADLLSIHGSGASEMIAAARRGVVQAAAEKGVANPESERCKLVAISVLTSMNQELLAEVGVEAPVAEQVARLSQLSYRSGADGMVCSPQEAASVRKLLGPDALIVCPGVRPQGSAMGDQKRVATPAEAIAWGASHLVVGRPIVAAQDPVAAADALIAELKAAHKA